MRDQPSLRNRIARLTALLFFASISAASAQTGEETPTWVPPENSKFDWVHTTSGEWLKGDVNLLRDRKVQFDSDNLGDVEMDWSDVKNFHLRKPHIFRLENGDLIQGTARMENDVVRVKTADGPVEIPRADLLAIVPGDGTELEYWSAYINASAGLSEGNTDQFDASGGAGFKRDSGRTRWTGDYRGIYAEFDGSKNAENHRASTRFDVFLTSRLFIRVPFADYYRDEFQNVAHRSTNGVSIGYQVVRNDWLDWESSVGPAYQYTEFDSGEEDHSHDATVVFLNEFNFDLPGGTELDNLYRLNVVATDPDNTNHHFESTLSVDIWGPLDLELTYILDRIEKPERDGDGERPDSNDHRLLAGISLDF